MPFVGMTRWFAPPRSSTTEKLIFPVRRAEHLHFSKQQIVVFPLQSGTALIFRTAKEVPSPHAATISPNILTSYINNIHLTVENITTNIISPKTSEKFSQASNNFPEPQEIFLRLQIIFLKPR